MKSKILIVCPFTSPNQGGVESHIQKLLSYIASQKRQAIVVSYQPLTTPTNAKSYERFPNYELYRMPWFGMGWFPKIEHNPILTFLYLVPGLLILSLYVGLTRKQEIGVIHAHGLAATFISDILNFFLRKRLVVSTHAIYNLKSRLLLSKLITIILKPTNFILAVGEPSRQEIMQLGFQPSQVAVHPNWVDTSFFKPKNKPTKKRVLETEAFQNSRPTILFVGRGLEKKGLFLFGELAHLNPALNFIARVGDGPDLPRFQKQYSHLTNLIIKTQLPSDFDQKMQIIRDEYQASDIFLMPSLYAEGFAAVVLEAASSGLAIISSNLGCLPDMLSGSGSILTSPTIKTFNHHLNELIKSPRKLQLLQTQIRQFALKHFSEQNAQIIYRSYDLD